ncbi:UDP-glucose 4-epimerase GalE [Aliidongia dinghuensis]|uniref:UDP-glucose 4-epimerase n=1 Tax=Aliidongia dinghuensis TaxID=1867774 RepID=A0A8J2YY27_9PROT|nr:UDP-glucose 4-epimerase GalE [Aliidongia dinghuensis]GGF38504.1 UDP-glucose 4-epimerase GalE [Aliidongia dinghuensis]
MAKNILVTGGAGYIGSHTAKALARAGYRPVTYDNLVYGHRHAVQWGPFVEGDILDTAKLEQVIRDEAIEAIVHFAAFAYVGESVTKPEIYFHNNVMGSLSILDAMRATGVKQIVFSSTCATYGMPDRMPITEETLQRPINPYGETKLMIERALHWYGPAHGIRSVSLRYFNACGADPEGQIGEEHDPETHLIPLILDAASGRRAAIDVYGTDYPTPDGTAIRDYIHVQDLADAHVKALAYLFDGGETTQLNLGTGTGNSVREVIDAVERVTGCKVPRREVGRRAGDPPELVANPAKANQLLGWKPVMSDIDSIIRTAWAWHQRGK